MYQQRPVEIIFNTISNFKTSFAGRAMDRLLITLGVLLSAWAAEASRDGCPHIVMKSKEFAKVFNNTCYLFVDNELYWNDARASCLSMGGEMLAIRNPETMKFIKSVLNSDITWGNNGVWIGARYSRGRWRWTTGEELDYNYWAKGEPSKILGLFSAEDCALMRRSDGWQWHDYLCGSLRFHYKYICEFRLEKSTTSSAPTTAPKTVHTPSGPSLTSHMGHHGPIVTNAPSGPGHVHVKDIASVSNGHQEARGPSGGHHKPLDLRGQEVHSMVLDHSARGGVAGRPFQHFQQHPAFHYQGHQSSQYNSQSQDNGNMSILTIILATGGVILMILLLVFFIFRKRYQRKFRQEPVVNFENRTYSEPLPPPPAPHHVVWPRPSSNLYLTPLEAAPLYEEVQKPIYVGLPPKDCNGFQGAPPLPPPYRSEESLGACGGVGAEDPRTPLMCGRGSEESLDSGKGGRCIKVVSLHNEYVDMNGSPVSSRSSHISNGRDGSCASDGGDYSLPDKPETLALEESKPLVVGDYSNLSPNRAKENVYEKLP